jgi:hypothetical protein
MNPKNIPMKAISIASKAAGVSLLFSVFLASNAIAGPGPQYWVAQGKPKADTAVSTTKANATPVKLCSGAEVVPVTFMKPAMPNGKGPLMPVRIGSKTVCHICPVTTRVTKSALANGKGPLMTSEVTKTGVEHNCAKCTGDPA